MSVFRPALFKGKVAIVTGGGTGIGKAISQELLSLGCRVVIASRKTEVLEATAKELNPNGDFVYPFTCNIRKEDDVRNLLSTTISKLGGVDFLVNNGGGQFPSGMADLSLKGWNAVIETNLTGTFLVSREAYLQWMKKNGGVIVNIVADYFRGFPWMGHTGAARAAVDNMTKTLAIEWAEDGVRVNAVAPGVIFSESAASNYGTTAIFDEFVPHMPTKRLGTPQEVASAVTYLLSPGAAFITGATLRVDGGSSLYAGLRWNIEDHQKLPAYKWDFSPDEGEGNSGKSKL